MNHSALRGHPVRLHNRTEQRQGVGAQLELMAEEVRHITLALQAMALRTAPALHVRLSVLAPVDRLDDTEQDRAPPVRSAKSVTDFGVLR
ncbi:hypothetical protein BX265_6866 [Streptomyces sp. TLI_235]|nr:hypothetical protein BX265_8397 [Streptomyces sp. TLI_235]PBC69538.1 hypothetical protein BX265_6866 [Streptomyces sp. TLI_235]